MIDREHPLSVVRQARLLEISRGAIYYQPRPTSEADLALMGRIDELHLEHPFMGARMLRRMLLREGIRVGRRHLGTLICVSEHTLSGCVDVAARPVGQLVLKGKKNALRVFEPLPKYQPPGYAPIAMYRSAYQAMRDGDPGASERFARLQEDFPRDPLVAFHCARLADKETGDAIVIGAK